MTDQKISLKIRISTRAAIVAGRATTGTAVVPIEDADLAELDPELRGEIAEAFLADEVLESEDPPIVEASVSALVPVLRARAASRRERERTALEETSRAAAEQAAARQDHAARDAARTAALHAWIEENGSDGQRDRLREGFLPEEEMLEAVADEMLEMAGYARYVPLYKGEACDCPCAGSVVFTEKTPPPYVDAYVYATLQGLREAVPMGASAEPYEHRAQCHQCQCAPIARITARVSLPWKGWLLVREFDLRK